MYIIRSEAGQPLREELAKSPQKILSCAFPEILPKSDALLSVAASSSGDENLVSTQSESSNRTSTKSDIASDAYFQGLYLIKTMVKLIPSWLQSNRTVFDALALLWKSHGRTARLQNEQELNLVQVSISDFIIYAIALCCKINAYIVPYLRLMWASSWLISERSCFGYLSS